MTKDLPETTKRANHKLDHVRVGRGWISKQEVDAIFMLLPQTLEHNKDEIVEEIEDEAGEDFKIHIMENVFEPKPSDLFVVEPFNLDCRHVFVGIIPVWRTEFDRRDSVLSALCAKAVSQAHDMGLQSLAFPLQQGGVFGFPKKRAARLIVQGVAEYYSASSHEHQLKEIRLVCDDKADTQLFKERLAELKS